MAEATSPLTTGQGRALQVLGHLFLRMGQFQRARKLAMALLALDPADLWARRCLAVAWLELGDPERALEQLNLVLAGGPLASRDAVLHLLRARALWQAQRPDEARNALNAYLAAGGSRL
ncbi:tetratricopeptide repeat protein [Desulfovibrio sp.]|uniref:type III secretion apparatus assembly chaperone SctY n=1 Tax=Desulfovibrio sp. TaxID=885 RepID=UPI002A910C4B|nr:tetratricopeptide repeat protein [Desulfovibrio sp.]MDY5429557.1 tetratricopeptide repeat protein [Desulfovibrio sp.]MDY6234088.1 tetratricopeptide repeat protein [Desulfovibrio sp.]